MLGHVLDVAKALEASKRVVVLGPGMKGAEKYVKKHDVQADVVIQQDRLGTGHAVQQAEKLLADFKGIVFVLYGDTPLISAETVKQMASTMQAHNAAIAVLGLQPEDPGPYGRLIVDEQGNLTRIVEAKDANEVERAVRLCNSGVMAIRGAELFGWLSQVTNDNANGEYYLTDLVALAVKNQMTCRVVDAPMDELLGVNDRIQLAEAERVMQNRLRRKAMLAGVTLMEPETVYFAADTALGQDVVVEPHVYFGEGVKVEDHVTLRAFSHLEGVKIAKGSTIGPYARLRPGTEIGANARIGNFVEIKKTKLDEGAKVSHLSYIGDAHVGAFANVGAGTITCNYNGYEKFHTDIGEYAFIGSNTALVAPVAIGAGAMIGAGSVITEDVEGDSLSMTRERQQHRQGWAKNFRKRKQN
jgi:bifunctional UDP-N-acetylglucosamine pyrophosphorylase/glucosamine-1-phosphate N-acetyltransferase